MKQHFGESVLYTPIRHAIHVGSLVCYLGPCDGQPWRADAFDTIDHNGQVTVWTDEVEGWTGPPDYGVYQLAWRWAHGEYQGLCLKWIR